VASFTSGRFNPGKKAPDTLYIGDWEGAKAGLDAVKKREICSPWRESNPNPSVVTLSLYRLSYLKLV
jgi:hypothetical protein